jgi:hypothetical protein
LSPRFTIFPTAVHRHPRQGALDVSSRSRALVEADFEVSCASLRFRMKCVRQRATRSDSLRHLRAPTVDVSVAFCPVDFPTSIWHRGVTPNRSVRCDHTHRRQRGRCHHQAGNGRPQNSTSFVVPAARDCVRSRRTVVNIVENTSTAITPNTPRIMSSQRPPDPHWHVELMASLTRVPLITNSTR